MLSLAKVYLLLCEHTRVLQKAGNPGSAQDVLSRTLMLSFSTPQLLPKEHTHVCCSKQGTFAQPMIRSAQAVREVFWKVHVLL